MNRVPAVWMVDDDPLVLKAGLRLLRGLGCETEGFPDGAAVLARLDAGPWPDLLVVDESMPGMRGAEVARRVLAERPGIRVALCTGYGVVADAPAGVLVLAKPFTVEDLAALLADALGPRA